MFDGVQSLQTVHVSPGAATTVELLLELGATKELELLVVTGTVTSASSASTQKQFIFSNSPVSVSKPKGAAVNFHGWKNANKRKKILKWEKRIIENIQR